MSNPLQRNNGLRERETFVRRVLLIWAAELFDFFILGMITENFYFSTTHTPTPRCVIRDRAINCAEGHTGKYIQGGPKSSYWSVASYVLAHPVQLSKNDFQLRKVQYWLEDDHFTLNISYTTITMIVMISFTIISWQPFISTFITPSLSLKSLCWFISAASVPSHSSHFSARVSSFINIFHIRHSFAFPLLAQNSPVPQIVSTFDCKIDFTSSLSVLRISCAHYF